MGGGFITWRGLSLTSGILDANAGPISAKNSLKVVGYGIVSNMSDFSNFFSFLYSADACSSGLKGPL